MPVFSQTLGQDEVIPRLQLIAQEVRDAAADGLMDREEDSPPLSPAEEPKVSEGEGKAGPAPESAAGPEPPMENCDAVIPDEPGEAAAGSDHEGEAGQEAGSGEAVDEKGEREGRIRELLFKKKGDIKAPPENPAYDKSVDELQDAAEPQPCEGSAGRRRCQAAAKLVVISSVQKTRLPRFARNDKIKHDALMGSLRGE